MDAGKKYFADSQVEITKGKKLPEGTFEAVIATDDLDRHGEHVSIKGMKIEKDRTYKVYYNHQTSGDSLPIGVYEKLWKRGNKLMGRFKLFTEEYDFAGLVARLIKAGGLDSMSVGFLPKEFDAETATWTASDFMEGSVVAEPANVQAIITSKSLDIDAKEFEAEAKKFIKLKSEDAEEAEEGPETEEEVEEVEKSLVEQIESLEDEEEIKQVYEALKAKTAAVGKAVDDLAQNPTESNVRKVKLHLRSIKGEADTMTHITKLITLKD